jgi:T4-like virus tail tube protein gp19
MGNGDTPPEVYTVSHVAVTIDGVTDVEMNKLLFNSAKPPDWQIEAPKHTFHGDKGAIQSIISAVQNPSYTTMTLTQGWDENAVLAKWRATVTDPSKAITDKKKHVKVDFLKSDGSILFSWDAQQALLTGYSHSGSDAGSNAVLTVTATIDADEWQHLDSSGSPITGA